MGRTNNHRNTNAKDTDRRRAGTGIDDFAHRKGVTKAIQDFRKRKDKKRTETAKALRHYKKTMKQEGYEPGQGASRKRREDGKAEEAVKQPQGRQKKSNPFSKSLQKAQQNKLASQQAAAQREAREKEREQKLKERRKRSKQLRQRTNKGQPVMKHVIHDILRKLENEKKQEEEQDK